MKIAFSIINTVCIFYLSLVTLFIIIFKVRGYDGKYLIYLQYPPSCKIQGISRKLLISRKQGEFKILHKLVRNLFLKITCFSFKCMNYEGLQESNFILFYTYKFFKISGRSPKLFYWYKFWTTQGKRRYQYYLVCNVMTDNGKSM